MTRDKQPKQHLVDLVLKAVVSDRAPKVSLMTEICERISEGERNDTAVWMIARNGTPQMVLQLDEAGVMEPEHWSTWKERMTPDDAELVLKEDRERWPHEVLEFATVLLVDFR